MAVLSSNYQYIGRSNAVGSPAGWNYYILLYAKTYGDTATGKHTVTVLQRMACDVDSSFYGFYTEGSVTVNDIEATAWSWSHVPEDPWNNSAITEGGSTYSRWIDLTESSAVIDTGYGTEPTVAIKSHWEMLDEYDRAWFPYTGVPADAEISVMLPMIAGATQPTVSNDSPNLGEPLTIYTPRLAGNLTHDLSYSFNNGPLVSLASDVGEKYEWASIPLSLAETIPNKEAASLLIQCVTRAGNTVIGTRSVAVTAYVPEGAIPSVSATWTDTSGAYEKLGVYVQNVSALDVSVVGTGILGSTIASVSVQLNSKDYRGGVITGKGTLPLTVTVTDSRGRSGTKEYSLTVAEYAAPQLTVNASRCTADGTADDMADHAIITVTGKVTQVNNRNTAKLLINSEKISVSPGDINVQKIVYADPDTTLQIVAELSDSLLTTTRSMVLSTGYATADLLNGGKGISFGKAATREGFDCAMAAYFSSGINGAYIASVRGSGGNTIAVKTMFPDFSGSGTERQSFFLCGSSNNTPIHGMLTINNSGVATWSGEGVVAGSAQDEGIAEITLPNNSMDTFIMISGDPFGIV